MVGSAAGRGLFCTYFSGVAETTDNINHARPVVHFFDYLEVLLSYCERGGDP